MKTIVTGKAPLSVITLVAILSLSLVVNLPGLAISPMLDSLDKIFPDSSQLKLQLLTLLPNVLIIPAILTAGFFSRNKHGMLTIYIGLILFTACAIAYFFADSMTMLIVISCLLGLGAGIIIPYTTGLIADTFGGRRQMTEMGIQSAIANLTLVVATYAVGWLTGHNWHLPFIVYLLVLIPLAMSPFLRGIPKSDFATPAVNGVGDARIPTEQYADESVNPVKWRKTGFSAVRTAGLFFSYVCSTFLTIVVSYYFPFLDEKQHWTDQLTGTVSALYFLFIFLPGWRLTWIIHVFKQYTHIVAACCITGGLALLSFVPHPWSACVGASLCGLGYGTFQPIIYDKATRVVRTRGKTTLAMAIILAANYVAIVLAPFVVDGLHAVTNALHNGFFAFRCNLALSVIFLIVVIVRRNNFSFSIPSFYYKEPAAPAKPDAAAAAQK